MDDKLNIFDANTTRIAVQNLDPDVGIMLREQIGDLFGPLNKAVGSTVKIFLVAHIQCFCLIFKTIKIKMKDPAITANVFVHDGKRWTGSLFCYSQLLTQRFNKRCFTGSHFAIKKKNFVPCRVGQNGFGSLRDLG